MKQQDFAPSASSNTNPAPQPNHLFAYSVEEYDAGNGKKGRSWTRIGAAFPHKEGPGFNIELRSIPLDGRIVLLPPDNETDAASENGSSSNGSTSGSSGSNRDDRNGHPRRR